MKKTISYCFFLFFELGNAGYGTVLKAEIPELIKRC